MPPTSTWIVSVAAQTAVACALVVDLERTQARMRKTAAGVWSAEGKHSRRAKRTQWIAGLLLGYRPRGRHGRRTDSLLVRGRDRCAEKPSAGSDGRDPAPASIPHAHLAAPPQFLDPLR